MGEQNVMVFTLLKVANLYAINAITDDQANPKVKISPVGTDGRLPLNDLDLGSGHTAYRRASLIDLYLHTKFH